MLASARSLGVDRVAGEVTAALEAAGVESLLVKGPAIAHLLYADGAPRPYADCDLLVRETDVPRAGRVLVSLGFARAGDEDRAVRADELHAHTWLRRRDRAEVDLHWRFVGVDADGDAVWRALADGARREWIGGREISVPSAAATALLVTLQLLQHGPEEGAKHKRDTERALALLDDGTWREAAGLARRLDAERAFGAGLRMAAGGAAVAARVGLPDDPLRRALASAPAEAGAATWVERLARTRGLRTRARLLARLVVPPRAYLELYHPAARRGRMRLALVYLTRPLALAARAPAVLLAWRRAHREARG